MAIRGIRAGRQTVAVRRPSPLIERVRAGEISLAIQHENLDDRIYSTLRGVILNRQLQAGERILVDHLAEEMRVSRTPILNALRRLSQEGVVQVFPRRGIYVRRYDKAEMVRLFAVREVLDGLATRLATPHIQRAEIGEFVRAFRYHGSVPATPAAMRRYVELDRRFHCRLIELADNDQLRAAMDSISMRLFVWQDGVVRPPDETIPEHLAILDMLRRRDAEAAEAAMRLHIRRSLEQLQREAATEKQVRGEGAQIKECQIGRSGGEISDAIPRERRGRWRSKARVTQIPSTGGPS
jgi:DNA-binding GntR family transcriptional regulator